MENITSKEKKTSCLSHVLKQYFKLQSCKLLMICKSLETDGTNTRQVSSVTRTFNAKGSDRLNL